MTYRGILVLAVFLLVLAAAGILFVGLQPTHEVEPNATSSAPVSEQATGAAISVEDSNAIEIMKRADSDAGFAASFGTEVKRWVLVDGHRMEKFSLGPDAVFARLSSSVPLEKTKVIDGLYVELPVDFAKSANGKRIEIGIVARGAQSNPTTEFSALYATQQAGNSGWQSLRTEGSFRLHTFEFDVPKQADGYSSKPVIAIRGDAEGQGRGLELIGVYAKVLAPPPFTVDFSSQTAEWLVPEGHKLTALPPSGGVVLGRLVSAKQLKLSDTNLGTQGAAVQIPANITQKLNGKQIEIAVTAKAATANPSEQLSIVFATQQSGNSGWKQFTLSPQLETYTLKYLVPAVAEGYKKPSIIVLQADASGTGKSVEVRSIIVTFSK